MIDRPELALEKIDQSSAAIIDSLALDARSSQCQTFFDGKQIHKVPQNIRKSIRMARHRKVAPSNSFIERVKYRKNNNLSEMDQKISHMQIQAHKIGQLKQIENLDLQSPLPETEADSKKEIYDEIRSFSQKEQIKQIRSRIFKSMADRIQHQREQTATSMNKQRKLSPLKKGSLIVQRGRKIPKKQLKITFLKIEKANLTNVYSSTEDKTDSQQKLIINQTYYEGFNMDWNKGRLSHQEHSAAQKQMHQTFTSNQSIQKQSKKKRVPLSESVGFDVVRSKAKLFKPIAERYYYRDFIWKVALSNGYLLQCPKEYTRKFKIYIGSGNNSMLIKSLFKRRAAWWTFTDRYEEANFVWTQIKINDVFKRQSKHQRESENHSSCMPLIDKGTQVSLLNCDIVQKKKAIFKQTLKILNQKDSLKFYCEYFSQNQKLEQKMDQTLSKRNKVMAFNCGRLSLEENCFKTKIHNHLPNNYILGNKKALYYTMTKYYERLGENPFEYLPQTYHVTNGTEDEQYLKFLGSYYPRQKKLKRDEKHLSDREKARNIWIVKPGEFTNRGNGIIVCMNLEEIKKILKRRQKQPNGSLRTYIIQSYIDRPLLYQRRKFDIRHFMMITSINGSIKGYWYEFGYIRTTSYEYNVKNGFASIHLTNDAVQKSLPDYGKFQKGNKVTYDQFEKYLQKQYRGKYSFYEEIYPKIKKIATDSIRACSLTIDPERKHHNFQIFGLDFMIDSEFKPWLIEINNNPCLELSCPYLAEIIPEMIENAMKICVDSVIAPPSDFQEKRARFSANFLELNKFELVYDSLTEQNHFQKTQVSQELEERVKELQDEADETFEDDGNELED